MQRGDRCVNRSLTCNGTRDLAEEQTRNRREEVTNSPWEMPNRGGTVHDEPGKVSSIDRLCRRPSQREENLGRGEIMCQRSPGCSKKGSLVRMGEAWGLSPVDGKNH